MMLIEGFRQQRESPAAAHFQFLLNDVKLTNSIHAFFEGRGDFSFYTNFLHQIESKPIHTYMCGTKRGVYETYRKVMQQPCNGTPLFFVDKDLSDILHEDLDEDLKKASNIYTTEYYSIENYLVSEEMLARIWRELFHFKNGILDFEKVHKDKFNAELNRFYEFMLPMMAWVVYLRRNGKKPNAKNVTFSRFFDWDSSLTLTKSEEMQNVGEIQLLERICGETTPETWESDADALLKELSSLAPKSYVRGKLELCFFVRFVDKLFKLLKENILCNGGDVTMKTQLSEENAIEILGPRLTAPRSLEIFLRKNLSVQPE